MEITQEQLKKLLAEAYEEGWRGFLEIRDEYAARTAASVALASKNAEPITFTVSDSSFSNVTSPYYYHYTTTLALPENLRNDEVI